MQRHHVGAVRSILLGSLLVASTRGFAQEPAAPAGETPAATRVSQDLSAGVQFRDVSAPEAKFDEYESVPDGAVAPEYKLHAQNEGMDLHFEAQDALQEDQGYRLQYNRDYRYSLDASYDQVPHNLSYQTRTLYNEASPGVWRLPDTVQTTLQGLAANATNFVTTYNDLNQSAAYVPLGFRTDRARVGFGLSPNDRWAFSLGLAQDRVNGKRALGSSFGRDYAAELPETRDWTVYNLTAGSQYATKKMQAGFSYGFSSFDNDVETMIWDSAKRATDQAAASNAAGAGNQSSQARRALAPDNSAHTFSANAGFSLPAETRFTADGTFSYMEQNQPLQAYTINSALRPGGVTGANNPVPPFDASDPANLPVSRAGARMLTYTQNYALTNRILKPVTAGLRFRSHQLLNRSPEIPFVGSAGTDQVWSSSANLSFQTKRFQYRKDLLEGHVDWRPVRAVGLGVRYGREWVNRLHREVLETREDILRVTTDMRPADWMLVRGAYTRSDRDARDFEIEDYENRAGTLIEMPGLRRYDTSSRRRHQGDAGIEFHTGRVTVGLSGALAHDTFKPGAGDLTGGSTTNQNHLYGMLENRYSSAGTDLTFDISERIALTAYYQFDQNRGIQRSNDSLGTGTLSQDAPGDWALRILDRYHTGSVVANLGAVPDRLDFRLGYEISRGRSASDYIHLGSGLNKTSPEEVKITRQDIFVRSTLKMTKNLSLVLGYLYEKFDAFDWQRDNVPLASRSGNQTNVYLGDSLNDYRAHIGSALIKYSWGH